MRKRKRSVKIHRTITSFCICFVHDPEIVDKRTVLMVRNRSDIEQMKLRDNDILIMDKPGDPDGKPAAIGLPGGGLKVEDHETASEAAYNETLEETGFNISGIRHLFTNYKYIIKCSKTDKRIREIEYHELGRTPSYRLRPNQYIIDNHVYVFHAEISWEDSPLQKILRGKKREFIASGDLIEEEVQNFGMWVHLDELTPKELRSLGISKQGQEEIDMIGIFPLGYLGEVVKQTKFEIFHIGFYPSHVKRVLQGCEQMEVSV